MKKLLESGVKISLMDQKVLEHFMLDTAKDWLELAVKDVINKAVKMIMRDYFEIYKSKATGNIPADKTKIISDIIAMNEFKKYNFGSPEKEMPSRDELPSREVLPAGIDIEDHEWLALQNFYKDPEQTIRDLLENKIAKRKKAFCKEYETRLIADPDVEQMPSTPDSIIELITNKAGYQNRVQKESRQPI